jgi:hypothetical protein
VTFRSFNAGRENVHGPASAVVASREFSGADCHDTRAVSRSRSNTAACSLSGRRQKAIEEMLSGSYLTSNAVAMLLASLRVRVDGRPTYATVDQRQ